MRLPWDLDAISGGIRANSTSSQGSGNSWLIGRITSAAVVLGVRFLAFSTVVTRDAPMLRQLQAEDESA